MNDFIMEVLMPIFISILVVMLIFLFFVGIYKCFGSKSEFISLKKQDWECSKTETYSYTTTMLIGKVMVPQIQHDTRCTQWSMK